MTPEETTRFVTDRRNRRTDALEAWLAAEPGVAELIDTLSDGLRRTTAVPKQHAQLDAGDLLAWLRETGYELVKLPDMVVDQDGFKTWPVDQGATHGARSFIDGTVRVRKTDGKIDFTSVFTPFNQPEHAFALAAALIAAARHVQEATDA